MKTILEMIQADVNEAKQKLNEDRKKARQGALRETSRISEEAQDSEVASLVINDLSAAHPKTFSDRYHFIVDYLKLFVGIFLLIGRVLSCLYRFILAEDGVILFFRMPWLNRWSESDTVVWVAVSIGGVARSISMDC